MVSAENQGSPEPLDSLSPPTVTFDTLAGNLPGVILATGSPYLIVSDIYVPPGKRVSVEAGVVFLFNNFTGLHVQGKLIAKGEKENPVVFTSVNDRDYNPTSTLDAAPFDWNGIYFHEDAVGGELSFGAVLYSVEGITSMTRFIRLSPVLFLNNGRADLTIEGEKHEVGKEPFEYALTVDDPALQGVPLDILKDPKAPLRNSARYAGLSLAVGGCVLGIMYAVRYNDALDRLAELSSTSDHNLTTGSSAQWTKQRDLKNQALGLMLTGFGIAVIGGGGLVWSFTF